MTYHGANCRNRGKVPNTRLCRVDVLRSLASAGHRRATRRAGHCRRRRPRSPERRTFSYSLHDPIATVDRSRRQIVTQPFRYNLELLAWGCFLTVRGPILTATTDETLPFDSVSIPHHLLVSIILGKALAFIQDIHSYRERICNMDARESPSMTRFALCT